VDEVNNALGEKLKIVGDPVYRAGVYYIVKKDANNELIDAVDSVIREMKADGSLATLLLKWYSEAAIPSDAVRK
jgi:ABC-type amino acid transport substrate-binding protein